MSREQFAFVHTLRVRWAEVDLQAVVFNGNYLTYFDVGFTEYWRATGLPLPQEQARAGQELYVRKCTIEFFASAQYDDIVEVCVRLARLGKSSMTVAVEIHRAGGDEALHLVSGELVYVYADTAAKRSLPLPDEWRQRMIALEKTPVLT